MQALQHFKAIHARHIDIEQQKINRLVASPRLLQRFQCLMRAIRHRQVELHLVTHLQKHPRQFDIRFAVIDQQHIRQFFGRGSLCKSILYHRHIRVRCIAINIRTHV